MMHPTRWNLPNNMRTFAWFLVGVLGTIIVCLFVLYPRIRQEQYDAQVSVTADILKDYQFTFKECI